MIVHSFPPLENPAARVLILGSMPGRASLQASQYYAHPQNAFWRILTDLLELPMNASYIQRIEALQFYGLALWDVLKSCHRPGSLDADIDPASIIVNDFAAFYARHPALTHVFFNGTQAATYYRKYVKDGPPNLRYSRLPSTSPAHASLTYAQKLQAWRAILISRK